MTYWTLLNNTTGVEKTLDDWLCTTAMREVANMSKDGVEITIQSPADAPDAFPYGTKITLYRGRTATGGSAQSASLLAAGLPGTGFTNFSGGTIFFVGYSIHNRRRASAQEESFNYRFAGPWEFFMEATVMQQLFFSYNAVSSSNIAAWRSQFVLGQSLNTLVGTADTVPGSSATNLMSLRQTIIQIVQYCIAQTANLTQYGSTPQFQFDTLTSGGNNASFTLSGDNVAALVTAGAKCLIPDFIPGYEASGQANQTVNLATVLRAPLDTVNDMMCAECMRYELKWLAGFLGSVLIWFDYTTSPPTLHIATRDILSTTGAVNLPYPSAGNGSINSLSQPLHGPQNQLFYASASDIVRRDDLIPPAVAIKFRIVGSYNGSQWVAVTNDIATSISGATVEGIGFDGALCSAATFISSPNSYLAGGTQTTLQNAARLPRVKIATIDMEGANSNACVINTIPVSTGDPASDGNALAMWQFLCPELQSATGLTLYSGSSVAAYDDQGNAIDLTEYQYILLDNSIPSWLNYGGDPLVKQATFKGHLVYQEVAALPSGTPPPTKLKQDHEKSPHATLIRIPGGTYASYTASEVIPYGLAGFMFNLESIPQYEGTYTIQEQEITDMCPMGSCLNLTGSANADWAAMNAYVQSISYDIKAARTEISFGPAANLGASDMVALNRANRGPRPYYLIGSNMANTQNSGSSSPTNVAQRSSNHGTEQNSQAITHQSLSDSQTNAGDYITGFPGITMDVRTSGQPNYGGISGLSAPADPTIHLQAGTGGTLGGCVRISATDAKGGHLFIQELPVCVNVGGTPTQYYAMFLMTTPYPTSGSPS
jgi:hypothetical protein